MPDRAPQSIAKRYNVGNMARVVGVPASELGVGDAQWLTERQAERLAVSYGLHPFVVWPAMVDDVIADLSRLCRWCGRAFIPERTNQAYCINECKRRANTEQSARWYRSSHGHRITRERQRTYYQRNAERIRDAKRAAYHAAKQKGKT